MNELQILVNQQPGIITTNFAEVKALLAEQMQVYKELEVTEANKVERKKDVATLRKMQKAIAEKKSEVRNECLRPYEEFNKLANELTEIISEPIGIIDNQVKEFEEKQRLLKVEEINKLYDALIAAYPDEMSIEIGIAEIYDNRWENATATMKSVKDEMTVKLDTIRNNFTLINSMASEKKDEALRLFWGDLDVAKAMTMINRYEQQKREIEQRMAEQQRKDREAEEERQRLNREHELEREKQKVRDEELARIRRENEIREEAQRQAREEEETKTRAREQAEREALSVQKWTNASNIVTAIYTIKAIPAELEQIEMYFNSIGVEFEKEDK